MHIEVDQSGKIEQTNKDTALAFSNEISYAVLIPARVKREAINLLRATGRRGKILYTISLILQPTSPFVVSARSLRLTRKPWSRTAELPRPIGH